MAGITRMSVAITIAIDL